MHMPGHKGIAVLGAEPFDITEINGADNLYDAAGIIAESEQNATSVFESQATFYSTEGSSQCIRAMLYLAALHAKKAKKRPLILAARNAHKTFVTAAGLLDLQVSWLMPEAYGSYLSCPLDAAKTAELEKRIVQEAPVAVYLTSPDYLGGCADIQAVAKICHRLGTLLLVDNAHGAYLKFLPVSRHPLDLGADLCCDSAHKTLPALTGAAYLHLGKTAPHWMKSAAKNALALFGSTSPSYLILQSLDTVNAYICNGYAEKLRIFADRAEEYKRKMKANGFTLFGTEPLKLTVLTKAIGYTGTELANCLQSRNIVCEFADPDFLVLMLSPELGEKSLQQLSDAFLKVARRPALPSEVPPITCPQAVLSIREALFAEHERIPTAQAEGRILAGINVSCPPAVPIAVCGERLDRATVARMQYYGISFCDVVQ